MFEHDNVVSVYSLIETLEEYEDQIADYESNDTDRGEETEEGEEIEEIREKAHFLRQVLESIAEGARLHGGPWGDEKWEGSWLPGELIAEDHFRDYAERLAEDCDMIPRNLSWPCNCIDWDLAADQLRQDYTEIMIDEVTYLYR